MERWDLNEGGSEVTVVRFHVSGPQGAGSVQVQVPANRRRGEFTYIIFEPARSRKMIHVLDNRGELAAKVAVAPPHEVPKPIKEEAASA